MLTQPRAAPSGALAGVSAALAFALMVLAADAALAAPGGTPRGLPLRAAAKPLPPVEGEVIVRFKADSAIVRQHALGALAKAEAAPAMLAKRAASLGGKIGLALEAGEAVGERVQVMRLRGADAVELARRLAADPEVEFAEPNQRVRRLQAVTPNDPLYTSGPAVSLPLQTGGPVVGQWYLRPPDSTFRSSIDAASAWSRGFGLSSVVVAVLDTGVRFEHSDLGRVAAGGKLLPGYDFVTNTAAGSISNDPDDRDADPSDPGDWTTAAENSTVGGPFYKCDPEGRGASEETLSSWHGTATASLVAAATNGVGMAGTAPGVLVLPLRVLGKCFGHASDIQAAIRWAAGIHVDGVPDNPQANWAKVINLSLGSTGACSAGYQAAVDEVVARGVVVIAAAGNSAGEPVGSPANCSGVIAVTALRHAGTKVGFSDLGAQIAISAPGGNCINTVAGQPCLYPILAALNPGLTTPVTTAQGSIWSDSFDYTIGTSFASPLVAGVAALLFSQNPALTVAQVRSLLQGTARTFPASGGSADATACKAPSAGLQQLECYCPNSGGADYPLCGAGMLDAGAAVRAAALGLVLIDVSPAAPTGGQAFTLASSRSVAGPGRTITGWSWALVSGGGIVSAFTGATNGATATLTPTGAGTINVRLTVTESPGGATNTTTLAIAVAAPAANGSSGGGSVSPWWLALLLLAVGALRRSTSRA